MNKGQKRPRCSSFAHTLLFNASSCYETSRGYYITYYEVLPYLPSGAFICSKMNFSSASEGENKEVTLGSLKALQWSLIGGLLAAKASGMYQPNLEK